MPTIKQLIRNTSVSFNKDKLQLKVLFIQMFTVPNSKVLASVYFAKKKNNAVTTSRLVMRPVGLILSMLVIKTHILVSVCVVTVVLLCSVCNV